MPTIALRVDVPSWLGRSVAGRYVFRILLSLLERPGDLDLTPTNVSTRLGLSADDDLATAALGASVSCNAGSVDNRGRRSVRFPPFTREPVLSGRVGWLRIPAS